MVYEITIENEKEIKVIYKRDGRKKKFVSTLPHESDLDDIFKYIGEAIMLHDGKKESVQWPKPKQ